MYPNIDMLETGLNQGAMAWTDTGFETSIDYNPAIPQAWPSEIWDSMAWSVQFLDTIQGSCNPG